MNLESFALLVAACFAINLTPGPSIALVSSVSAAHGFKAAFCAVIGMGAGAMVHILFAASGLAALLATSPLAFTLVQYLGAIYLIYLGVDLLRSPLPETSAAGFGHATRAWQYFRRGFFVDALNPKIAVFFLAFIPQFLHAVETPGFSTSVLLGSVFIVTGTLVNATLAYLIAAGSRRLRGPAAAWIQRWIPGGVMISLGMRLLWQPK